MKGISSSAAAEADESQSQAFSQKVHSSLNFTFGDTISIKKDALSNTDHINYRSPRISPDMHVTDINMDFFPCDAMNNCPEVPCLSKSRSLTPVQDSKYESFHYLDRALSESAKQYPNDFIDPVAYACRSIEERRQKSIEEGKVSRPLNSYMLYRKAYQQVARRVIRKDQQQSASQTVGTSWTKLECDEIKSKFRALAKIDHEKHLEAFPTYRYTPTQGKGAKSASEIRRSMIAERKSLRRSGQRSVDLPIRTKQSFNPPVEVAVSGDQCYNNSFDWWFRERQDEATLLPQIGNMYDGYESYTLPNSTCFGVSFQDEAVEHATGHLSRHMISNTGASVDYFDLDPFIDPSLWSRFDGNSSQFAAPMQWQGRDTMAGHHFMPETALDHLVELNDVKQERL
ncbi:hypothetical protein E4U09_004312 [Claviceps aff. purpurea]|uniref:HMG box domain-containing protein n=1 Tax=Claviceps aff. purpurea TaxID=1967640 RepID=A0A9P7QDA6_9HYPO|nr:hypothetical protein E4U09_004312 [Claviceps aff. purpurea]